MAKRKHEENDGEVITKTQKTKSVSYGNVTVFYFPRVQSFTCVPSLGGVAIGLAAKHCYKEQRPLCTQNTEEKIPKERTTIEPLTAVKRKKILRLAGLQRWKKAELKQAKDIRLSRLNCGCRCGDYCFPQTCSCCLNGIGCQVDEGTFPCSCRPNCCLNDQGRHAYNQETIERHRLETLNQFQGART